MINLMTDLMRWDYEARQERQKDILKKLHKLQIQYFSKVTMWIQTNNKERSIEVTIFCNNTSQDFEFYEFRDDDEIKKLFERLKKALKDESKTPTR